MTCFQEGENHLNAVEFRYYDELWYGVAF
jgi:hypothetical protein